MTGFLTQLAARSLATAVAPPQGAAPLIVPRPLSMFEPAGGRRVDMGPALEPGLPDIAVELDRAPVPPSPRRADDSAEPAADEHAAVGPSPPDAPVLASRDAEHDRADGADRATPGSDPGERTDPAPALAVPRQREHDGDRVDHEPVAATPVVLEAPQQAPPAQPAAFPDALAPPAPAPGRLRPPARQGDARPNASRRPARGPRAAPQAPVLAGPAQRPRLAVAGMSVRAREAERSAGGDQVVHVSIGRVDIRAVPEAPAPRRAATAAARPPAVSLSDYLAGRDREASR